MGERRRIRVLGAVALVLAVVFVMLLVFLLQSPQQYRIRMARADRYLESGDYEEAVLECREAGRIKPRSTAVYLKLGEAYRRQAQQQKEDGEEKKAVDSYLRANAAQSMALAASEQQDVADEDLDDLVEERSIPVVVSADRDGKTAQLPSATNDDGSAKTLAQVARDSEMYASNTGRIIEKTQENTTDEGKKVASEDLKDPEEQKDPEDQKDSEDSEDSEDRDQDTEDGEQEDMVGESDADTDTAEARKAAYLEILNDPQEQWKEHAEEDEGEYQGYSFALVDLNDDDKQELILSRWPSAESTPYLVYAFHEGEAEFLKSLVVGENGSVLLCPAAGTLQVDRQLMNTAEGEKLYWYCYQFDADEPALGFADGSVRMVKEEQSYALSDEDTQGEAISETQVSQKLADAMNGKDEGAYLDNCDDEEVSDNFAGMAWLRPLTQENIEKAFDGEFDLIIGQTTGGEDAGEAQTQGETGEETQEVTRDGIYLTTDMIGVSAEQLQGISGYAFITQMQMEGNHLVVRGSLEHRGDSEEDQNSSEDLSSGTYSFDTDENTQYQIYQGEADDGSALWDTYSREEFLEKSQPHIGIRIYVENGVATRVQYTS